LRAAFPAALLLALAPRARAIEVSTVRERLEPGEGQEAVVSGLAPGEWFRAAWLDPTGRVRRSWDLRAGRGGARRVGFRTGGALPGEHRVVAWPWGSPPAEGARAGFEVLRGAAPAYLTVLDAPGLARGPAEDLARIVGARAVASSGPAAPAAPMGWVVRALEGGPPFLGLDEADLRARRTAYERSPADALLARPACLRDRSWLVHVWRWAEPRAESAARAGPWLWSLGRDVRLADERGGLDFCRSPHCARAFISDLQSQHDDITSLNGRWGTAFKRWTDVRSPTAREAVEALRTAGVGHTSSGDALAAWSDHRDFLDRTWIAILRDSRELLRSVTRRARVGLGGADLPGVFTGADPTRIFRAVDWMDVAPKPLDLALARSFAPRECRLLTRLGADASAEALLRGLANGHSGAVLLPGTPAPERGRTPGAGLGAAPRPWRALPDVLGSIESGLGEIFALSTWEPDPVVVLYSPESIRVEWAVRAARGDGVRTGAALAAWARLLSDIGLAARFVDPAGLGRALRDGDVRALILSRAYVLGSKELAEIDRFAVAGGLVVADASAGVFNERFEPGPAAGIESIFGISRERGAGTGAGHGGGEIVFSGMDLPGAYIDGVDRALIDLAEPDVRAIAAYALARRGPTHRAGPTSDADASGAAVGLLTNPYGRGRGVYLNLGFESYPEERLTARGANARRLVRNVLELARVGPRVGVVARGGELDGCERIVRRIEELELIALHRDVAFGADKVAAELVFARPALCFDVLKGVLIGRGERVRLRLRPGPNVFARLPYDVERISLKASERGGTVRYRGMVETPTDLAGTHVIRRELRDAGGRLVPGGEATIIADRGVFKGAVALAENEPEGEYWLVFRDVASGVEAEVAIGRSACPLGAVFPLAKEAPPDGPDGAAD
jgi:hypothetical protein